MRIYETTFILSPQSDDTSFDRQIKAVGELINRYQGKILREDRWGVRRLAYPIKKFTQGYYTRLIFEGNSELLLEMERLFRIEESYIRYLTIRYQGKVDEPGGLRELPAERPMVRGGMRDEPGPPSFEGRRRREPEERPGRMRSHQTPDKSEGDKNVSRDEDAV
jgi:small subunit ribosomal protein S6